MKSLADDPKLGAWNAFPPDIFTAEGRFTQLSKAAIRDWWQPRWHDTAAWQAFRGAAAKAADPLVHVLIPK